jgi:hypothetical protein
LDASKIDTSNATLDPPPARSRWRMGLSLKLLTLTIIFVMVAEIMIFVPSVANFRRNWLDDRLAAAQVAVMVLEASPREGLPAGLETQLLDGVGALAIAARLIALMQNLTEILNREARHVHSLGRDRLRSLRLPVPGDIARIAEAIESFGADRHGRLLRWR